MEVDSPGQTELQGLLQVLPQALLGVLLVGVAACRHTGRKVRVNEASPSASDQNILTDEMTGEFNLKQRVWRRARKSEEAELTGRGQ